jgi:hypothetical protein
MISTTIQVAGVKDTINELGKIDKQLQKDFKADAIAIAAPAVKAAQNSYFVLPLSGMKYNWRSEGRTRKNFPFTVAAAVKGVRVKFDTRRGAVGVILIEQSDPAAAIFETAGRANANRLGDSLGFVGAGRTRLIGPAVYRARKSVERDMENMIKKTQTEIQRGLK